MDIPPLASDEFELVARRAVGPGESVGEAILEAFEETDVDVMRESTVLQDWLNVSALENLDWESDPDLRLTAEVWDRVVVITPDQVAVYRPRTAG